MNGYPVRVFKQWFPLAVGFSVVCCIIYVVVQQDIRTAANDPQIQMAQDTAATLQKNNTIQLSGTIDVAHSLAPFTIIYNSQGKIISTNASLNGTVPSLPSGVLQSAKQNIEERITWQPQNGVRLASVIVPFNNGYVLVGRNMREVEAREDHQLHIITAGWFVGIVVTFISVLFVQLFTQTRRK